ncbi:MAG: cupin domain-containing protein [Hyphomonas sp.]|nr:cupin domain-containing protein [Hyphomonas sp.]
MDIQTPHPERVADDLSAMEFASLASFNGGEVGVFWSEPGGTSPWEMHPDCDEMLQIISGEIDVEILPSDGGSAIRKRVSSGSFIVIPKGCWHRQTMLERTKEIYVTPGKSLHSLSEDPRLD